MWVLPAVGVDTFMEIGVSGWRRSRLFLWPAHLELALGESRDAILERVKRLGLEVVDPLNFNPTTTSKSDVDGELQSAERRLRC